MGIKRIKDEEILLDGGNVGEPTAGEMLMAMMDDEMVQIYAKAFGTLFALMVTSRFMIRRRLGGEHTVNLCNLDNVIALKEVMMTYLGAIILEPVFKLTAFDSYEGNEPEIIIFSFSLCAICWWIYLITDAFSSDDVMQRYEYHNAIRDQADKNPKAFKWLKYSNRPDIADDFFVDMALWFNLANIVVAWLPGVVNHHQVMHSYSILILWIILHHYVRKAVHFGNSYFVTLLSPSTALFPLEYCLPLMDVGNLEFVEDYRAYIEERTLVSLNIVS